MAVDRTLEERMAVLEEHLVAPPIPTTEEWLARAERAIARGDERGALHCLTMAKIHEGINRSNAIADGWGDDEDDGDDDA